MLLLIFVYAAGIIFYVHYKQRQKRKEKDPEQNHSTTMSTDNGSMESRIDMSNVVRKKIFFQIFCRSMVFYNLYITTDYPFVDVENESLVKTERYGW